MQALVGIVCGLLIRADRRDDLRRPSQFGGVCGPLCQPITQGTQGSTQLLLNKR